MHGHCRCPARECRRRVRAGIDGRDAVQRFEYPELGRNQITSALREPAWKFWNRSTHIGDQLEYKNAKMIFRPPNHLVFDKACMNQLGRADTLIEQVARKDLGESAVTHPCRYFRDPGALAFLESRLR